MQLLYSMILRKEITSKKVKVKVRLYLFFQISDFMVLRNKIPPEKFPKKVKVRVHVHLTFNCRTPSFDFVHGTT